MKFCALALVLCVSAFACGDKEKPKQEQEAAEAPSPQVPASDASPKAGVPNWVPAEFKGSRGKWRDPGVYVDGRLTAFIWYHELPRQLKPVYIETEESLDFKPGDKGPRSRIIKERRFRVAEYIAGLGYDLEKIKAVHIYGGKTSAMEIPGERLRKFADTFYFDFGRETSGKPRLFIPEKMKVNTRFDQIKTMAIYIKAVPPTFVDDDVLVLDGKQVLGVPYYGKPLRGGVRFYVDDRIATVLKRNASRDVESIATPVGDEGHQWRLFDFLAARGVKTDTLARVDAVCDDKREKSWKGPELAKLTFFAGPKAKGAILLGDKQEHCAQAMMFYSQ